MARLSVDAMRDYLRRSLSSLNQNKLRGLLAEISFRDYLKELGFLGRVSPGGWIVREVGAGRFGHTTAVIFPYVISPGEDLPPGAPPPTPTQALHTICSTFHQSGITAYYCAPSIAVDDDPLSIVWQSVQLGVPQQTQYGAFPASISGFPLRKKKYSWLRYKSDASAVPDAAVPDEFSKEHVRVTFQTRFVCEISDVDGIFWGNQFTYPVEIKEKTAAKNTNLGEFFGLDVGPFVKLAYYAAKRGNLHSLFVVREIDSPDTRALTNWWYITFDHLAQFASWVPQAGGKNMLGGGSSVVKVPKAEFSPLNAVTLNAL